MSSSFNDPNDIPNGAPSRTAHRRPPLKRTHASHNVFPDLPPIQTACPPPADITTIALADDVASVAGSDPCDHGDLSKVDLSPTCPPSPPSSISSSSESSTSSLATPVEPDDWEQFHDGFAPPPNPTRPPVHSWPPTPNPNIPPHLHPQARDSYHGWSENSLFERKRFWYRRHRTWWDYDEHCRQLHNYLASTSASESSLDATTYYPPSPALLPSRLTPWSGPNGLSFDAERIATDALALPRVFRLQVHSPWAPVFPRFGDIEDLRDPFCEHLDRMFMNFPPYAISKLLYVEQMAAQEHHPRAPGQGHFPPTHPSPPASFDAPWSPASVYSDDGRGFGFPEVSAMATSSTTSLASPSPGLYGGLRWLDRWELLRQRLFPGPQSISPSSTTTSSSSASSLLPSAESDPALSSSPVHLHLPPRPGTPLPDDEQLDRATFLAPLASSRSDDEIGESAGRDGPLDLDACAAVDPGGPSPPPEVNVHAPAPLPERDTDSSLANDDDDAGLVVVRLPPSPSHPPRIYLTQPTSDAQDTRSPRRRSPRTLADELSAALGDAVQFSIVPPSAVAQVSSRSRFSFFAEETEFEYEYEYEEDATVSAFDVGAITVPIPVPAMVSTGLASVHVEAVPC
ncbi:hypothetical protein GSI_08437 [Ganoderma sinense ZZ0214-1]|uniref:Uncharacterized protein n=1 Tax=Ganoderma sinense ZZ0214-1 TaxID=1077348 RepID=A0A2G8S6X0_9APHY|nr:hypothetical protein GSI_08437 [Ganoderma sinense ZZ0214-1]